MEIHNTKLTSAEIGSLWSNYLGDTMGVCILQHFMDVVEDEDIQWLIAHALDFSQNHIEKVTSMFIDENYVIPRGFTKEDVKRNAPRLFSDTFMLNYIKHMAKGGLALYGSILPNMVRKDVRQYFANTLDSSKDLYDESTDLSLKKGVEIRPPYIPEPKEIEWVDKQRFMAGWFGEQRPLTATEIMHLYSNIQTNKLGETLILGFAQVAQHKKAKNYFSRGKEISKKHINLFSTYLNQNSLPSPMSWDHAVSTSTSPPFSDKLMMYHIGVLNATGIGNYGVAMSLSQRRDITVNYSRLMVEIGKLAEDGMNIMINESWMERPPQAADRDELMNK
ncbi:DUF3231 family protein [Virgibacillus sp. DJP39]|uniref:DUF3231 family protein n=1 Tax=Virgibacillus sp. DJP39 TaxID=3409790 RepID=UPI003BB57D60